MPDGTPEDSIDRLSGFRPVGWYADDGVIHLFEGETLEPTDTDADPAEDEKDHLLYWAWTIIANAGEGDWTKEHPAWQKAAADWRDRWHAQIKR